jgi:hypothetical protein
MKKRNYKIGDKVLVVDEDVCGVIAFAKADSLIILTNDGLTLEYFMHEVVLDQKMNLEQVVVKEEPAKITGKVRAISRKKAAQIPAVEVDLHIHQLVKNERGMDAYDMLNIQLDTARHKVEWAKRERIPKLVFIHGVGAGVLRTELEYLFSRYPEITFYDADFQKYGKGATEVYIFQNPKMLAGE